MACILVLPRGPGLSRDNMQCWSMLLSCPLTCTAWQSPGMPLLVCFSHSHFTTKTNSGLLCFPSFWSCLEVCLAAPAGSCTVAQRQIGATGTQPGEGFLWKMPLATACAVCTVFHAYQPTSRLGHLLPCSLHGSISEAAMLCSSSLHVCLCNSHPVQSGVTCHGGPHTPSPCPCA